MALRIVAILPLVCGIGLVVLAATPMLAQQRTRNQISSALIQLPTGGLSAAELARAANERRFLDEVRNVPTRAIKIEAREKLAAIAARNPGIDLEINFDPDSATIGPQAAAAVIELGRALSEPDFRGQVFLLEGHTEAGGSDAYKLTLSDRRAEAVKQYLVEKFKLPPTDLLAVGYGRSRPKNTADGLAAENRRVRVVNITP
jgi:outer membrane protein OmpA-like peptidoglycan-associated protein